MRNEKHIFYLLTAVVLLVLSGGCSQPVDNSQLVTVDSLLAQNRSEEALQMLQAFNADVFNNNDKAYYDLLTTQANHDCRIAATSYEVINEVVKYYKAHNDK